MTTSTTSTATADSLAQAVADNAALITGNISEDEYEDLMTSMYQQRLAQYENYVKPLMDEIEEESESTALLDRARENVRNLDSTVEETAARVESYSMDGMLPSQRQAAETARSKATSKAKTGMITEAASADVERRAAARQQLMTMTESLQSTGTASIADAISQKTERDAAYSAARSGLYSSVGAVAGGIIGGYASGGNPAGVAAGSAIGSSIGSYVGG